ncbi:MAG: hypothetical protein FWD51_00095 [Betaproteobacteria bacterium]|nr:hypothetical protein [Betaproteobacteria bacterium]
MSFFQSFIGDANRSAEPVVHAPVAESPAELTLPTDTVSALDAHTMPLRSSEPQAPPSVQQNALLDGGFEAVELPVSAQDGQDAPPETIPSLRAIPPRRRIRGMGGNETTLHGAKGFPEQPSSRGRWHAEGVMEGVDREIPGIQDVMPQKPGRREFLRNTDVANQDKRPDVSRLDEENTFTQPSHQAKRLNKPALKTAETVVSVEAIAQPTRFSGQETSLPAGVPHETHEHAPDAIPVTHSEVAQKKAPAPLLQAAMAQIATTQESETIMAAAVIQQAKQALGLPSLFADSTEKPSPVREKSEPRVQIGTIEVIVESRAPAIPQKPSPNTGFTRDPGRYYQRRL